MAARSFYLRIANATGTSFNKQQHKRELGEFSLAKLRGNSSTPSFSTNTAASSAAPTHADAADDLRESSPVSPSSSVVKTSPTAWWGPDPDTGMWCPAPEGQLLPFTGSVSADEQEPWFREDVHLHYHLDHRSA